MRCLSHRLAWVRRAGASGAMLALFLTLVPSSGADAQVRLQGSVVDDSTTQPIDGAMVIALDHKGRYLDRAVTDENGAFELEVDDGREAIRLRVSRLGYQETTTPYLFFDDYRHFGLEVRLRTDAVLLAPLEVVVRSRPRPSAVLEDMRQRLESGLGWYVTREEIEERGASYVTDLLATVPGVRLHSAGRGTSRIVSFARTAGWQDCAAQIYVDGILMNRRYGRDPAQVRSVDDFVSPESVEAIEVYRGLSTVPAEFLNEDARCGVVAIWTRRGG